MILRLFRACLFSLTLALAGCHQLADYTVTKHSDIDRQITAARVETEDKLRALNDQQIALLKGTIATHETREQDAANYLFKGLFTYGSLKTMSRPEMVMGQSIQQTAAQLPPATLAAQAKGMEELKTELDEARISNETLKTQYETELGKARTEGIAKDKALTDLASSLKHVDNQRVEILAKANQTETELNDKRHALDTVTIAAQQEEVKRANDTKAIRIKLSSIVGGLALLCIAGAIWSPVFKPQFAIGAAVFGLIAVAIWWIQAWMVATALGVAAVGVILWVTYKHHVESKTASSVYHAIQSVKDTATADYERLIKPALTQWMSVYTKDGSTVPDQTAIAHVDKVLMSTGAK